MYKSKSGPSIVAVGYKIDIPVDQIIEEIKKKLGDEFDSQKYEIETEIYSGVMYGSGCRGGLHDVMSDTSDMIKWYEKQKKKGDIELTLNNFYISKAPKLIIAETTVPPNKFFVFIANPAKVSTTQFKRNINTGRMGTPLEIRIKTTASPYMY